LMQDIDKWVDEILQDNSSLILVEGNRDIKALNKLGINNVNSINKPIYSLIEDISRKNKEVIVLTDFDHEGRKLYSKIKHELNRNGIKVNDKYRRFLSRCKITHIEGLFTYYKNNSKEVL
jgi:5S rRNA maturation endonuclease (ribonuclease M5)